MSNRQYDFTLAAIQGASQRIDATGAKLKVLSAPGGSVGVKVDGGQEISLMEGQGFNMPAGKTFRDVVVRNLQAVANVGTIFIGDEGFEDSRITGSVRIIDSAVEKTALLRQYIHSIGQVASAGNVSLIGIAANGTKAAVKRIQLSSPTAGLVYMIGGTNLGTATVVQTSLINKSMGGALSNTKLTLGYSAGTLPVVAEMPGAFYWLIVSLSANVPQEVPLTTPLLLSGTGVLAFSGGVVNRDLSLIVDLEEVD